MIPPIIHFCWFGRRPLPPLALKCIGSWRRFFPDFEIKEWNEDNFDIDMIPYSRESYKAGKYAFVSDFARYWILNHHGGVYFDTDVEVIRDFDEILKAGPFLGIEKTRQSISINPGLGMGAPPGMDFYKMMIDIFSKWQPSNSEVVKPLLIRETTGLMEKQGWIPENRLQTIDGISIYPNEFFNPFDDYTGKIHLTSETRSIHFYAKTWIDGYSPMRNWISKRYHRLLNMFNR